MVDCSLACSTVSRVRHAKSMLETFSSTSAGYSEALERCCLTQGSSYSTSCIGKTAMLLLRFDGFTWTGISVGASDLILITLAEGRMTRFGRRDRKSQNTTRARSSTRTTGRVRRTRNQICVSGWHRVELKERVEIAGAQVVISNCMPDLK